ncbi:MAG: antibiotic biosynthesis monooxygenase [Actinomycetota bacterium]|nr:antibiotic biosynthesis monooxygenase [Actinomycetota bacterium]
MYARVSTYQTGPDTISDAPSEDTVRRAREMPGCLGIYYLNGKEAGKDLSITLWESEEAMTESRAAANKIRAEASAAEKTQILAVEEFEVTVSNLKS